MNLSRPILTLLALCLCALTTSCAQKPEAVALSMIAYNYTGRGMHYSVDGYGGGSVTEEGSGDVCCLSFRPDTKVPFNVVVEWTLEDRRDFEHDKWIPVPHPYEKRSAVVSVSGPIPAKPSDFEVHFLPGGTVRAFITDAHTSNEPFFTPNGQPLRPLP